MRLRPTPTALKPIALALVAAALAGVCCQAQEANWDVVSHNGEDYITTRSLQNFYRFKSYDVSNGHIFYKSPDLVMKARSGSKNLLINNTKFVLSHPVAAADGKFLISRMDLCKLIDPVLRPSFIKMSSPFQTIILDAGHGGIDTGTKGAFGNEKDHALRLTNILKKELERRGFRVKMTRTGDQNISRAQRVAFANKVSNAIFVSLHFNDGARAARGIETYALSPQGAESTQQGPRASDNAKFRGNQHDSANIALATAVHASVIHKMRPLDRGIKRARWDVLTGINKPAILFEGGFLTNPSDAKQISSYTHLTKLAGAIADGVVTYRNALRRR